MSGVLFLPSDEGRSAGGVVDQTNQVPAPSPQGRPNSVSVRSLRFQGSTVSVDMGWLSPLTEIAVSKVGAFLSVDLWISVKVSHTLDVHHNQLMTRTLKCEVAEGLCRGRKRRSCSRPD